MTDDRAGARAAVVARMAELRYNPTTLARLADVDVKTVRGFVSDGRWPQVQTRAALAVALGWKSDEIDAIAARVPAIDRHTEAQVPLTGASDAELLAEVARRFSRPLAHHIVATDDLEGDELVNRTTELQVVAEEEAFAAHEEEYSIEDEQEWSTDSP